MDAGACRNGKPLHFLSRKTRQRDFCGSPFACVSDEGSPTPFPLPKKICLGKDFLERGGIGVVSAVSAPRANTRQMRHIPTKERADLPQAFTGLPQRFCFCKRFAGRGEAGIKSNAFADGERMRSLPCFDE